MNTITYMELGVSTSWAQANIPWLGSSSFQTPSLIMGSNSAWHKLETAQAWLVRAQDEPLNYIKSTQRAGHPQLQPTTHTPSPSFIVVLQ